MIARRGGSLVELEVADRGPGLAPGEEALIFEKFQQGRAGGTAGGVGLGLAICKAIVEAHGAPIAARGNSHGGASFVIAMPAEEPPPLPEEENE